MKTEDKKTEKRDAMISRKTVSFLLAVLLLVLTLPGCAKAQPDMTADSTAGSVTDTAAAAQEQPPLATVITSSDYQNSGTFMTFRILPER